jgi:exonuclease III
MAKLQLLNWNIAGLPRWIWWIKGLRFMDGRYRLISRILAEADFVCLQEAFRHRGALKGKKLAGGVPWAWVGGNKKSGLMMMAREAPLVPPRDGDFKATTFSQADFFAQKGWLAAKFSFGWLLTTHLDAGPDQESLKAREKQLKRIVNALADMDRPIIMAGDFNLSAKRPGDVELLESFLAETGFEIILHHGKDLIMAQDILLEGADVFENESLSDHSRLVALI